MDLEKLLPVLSSLKYFVEGVHNCFIVASAKNASTKSASKRLVEELLANYGSRSVRPRLQHSDPVDVSLYFKPTILSSFVSIYQSLFIPYSQRGFCLTVNE